MFNHGIKPLVHAVTFTNFWDCPSYNFQVFVTVAVGFPVLRKTSSQGLYLVYETLHDTGMPQDSVPIRNKGVQCPILCPSVTSLSNSTLIFHLFCPDLAPMTSSRLETRPESSPYFRSV